MASIFARIEALARTSALAQSTGVIGLLSGMHLLGLTLLLGSVLVSSLRLFGVLLPEYPVRDVAGGARRGVVIGLATSVASGLLLVAPRLAATAADATFQWKMLLLVSAACFHAAIYRRSMEGDETKVSSRVAGIFGLVLWLGVAVAGSAFILLE